MTTALRCAFQPADAQYAPCSREKGHSGPCAHALALNFSAHPEVIIALRKAMKAGKRNERILIENIEDFAPPEIRAAFDALIETVARVAIASVGDGTST